MSLPPRTGRKGRTPRTSQRNAPLTDAEFNRRRIAELRTMPQPNLPIRPLPDRVVIGYYNRLLPIADQSYAIAAHKLLPILKQYQALADQHARADDLDPDDEGPPPEGYLSPDDLRVVAQNRPSFRKPGVPLTVPLQLTQALTEMDTALEGYTKSIPIPTIIGHTGKAINEANQRMNVEIAKGLGVRPVQPGNALHKAAQVFTAENAALIVSQPKEVADRVRALVEQGVPEGMRWETIAKRLVEEEGIAQRRAALIARDQCSKYNADLNRIRQTAVGITHYEWRGVMDARERPSHVALQGEVFAWDSPPPVGHAGTPIGCRCQSVPVSNSRGIARQANITEADLVDRIAALGPTQREGPDATPEQVRKRAQAEVASDVRLAQRRESVRRQVAP